MTCVVQVCYCEIDLSRWDLGLKDVTFSSPTRSVFAMCIRITEFARYVQQTELICNVLWHCRLIIMLFSVFLNLLVRMGNTKKLCYSGKWSPLLMFSICKF